MTQADAGYQVRYDAVTIPGAADLQIRSLLDRQQYHDPDGAAERAGISAASWPLFGQVWPSSRMLASEMANRELADCRILELGCGLALASLVAHRRQADVTASDLHPLTEGFLQENLRLNALPPMAYQTGDWQGENPRLGLFDMIIGSDVLYERSQPAQLARFIDRHSRLGVEVLIVDPDRGNRSSFNQQMAALGYSHSAAKLDGLQSDGKPYKGRLLRYARS